jgi:P-type E1-E2 ATPase
MLTIDIPGSIPFTLRHLVLDYNGTLAEDGELLSGVDDKLRALRSFLEIHIITADTHGTVRQKLAGLQVHLKILGQNRQDEQKAQFVRELGAPAVAAMGNGRNDVKMLAAAGLGVGILQREGCAAAVLTAARIVCTDIRDGLDLLLYPERLRATLRN